MLRILIMLYLCQALLSTMANAQGLASRLEGVWEGEGAQNNETTWTMMLTVSGGEFTIEYPSLTCGGTWTLLSDQPYTAAFFEDITFGLSRCIDEGTLELFIIDGQTLRFIYFLPNNGDIEAYGELRCTTCDVLEGRNLLLPAFEVDTTDPAGLTTFFAIHNGSDSVNTANVKYFDEESKLLSEEDHTLAGNETRSITVRNVPGLVPGADGIARGWIQVSFESMISGDYFYLDQAGNFATGDQLLEQDEVCRTLQARIVDFGSGTKFRVYATTPMGADPEKDVPTATILFLDEAGTPIETGELFTDKSVNVIDSTDLTGVRFGTAVFDFGEGAGALSVEYSAFGLYSVTMNATCTVDDLAR